MQLNGSAKALAQHVGCSQLNPKYYETKKMEVINNVKFENNGQDFLNSLKN